MRRSGFAALFFILLAGCSVVPAPTATPNPGSVTIQTPQTGAMIYSPTLYLSGAANLPSNQFRLTVINALDETLLDTLITVQDGRWSYDMPNAPTGDPIEVTISALPATGGLDLDTVSVVLASEAQRPAGVYGAILAPFEGDTVGGEIIPVSGTASGLFEGALNVDLTKPDGTIISGIVLTVENPGMIDEVPWQTEISTSNYRGPAVLHAYYHSAKDGTPVTLAKVAITVAEAAG